MKKIRLISIFAISTLSGCTTIDQYEQFSNSGRSYPAGCHIIEYSEGSEIKAPFKIIGDFSVTESGLSVNCSEYVIKTKIRERACSVGADGVQYYNVLRKNIRSTCFQTRARFILFK